MRTLIPCCLALAACASVDADPEVSDVGVELASPVINLSNSSATSTMPFNFAHNIAVDGRGQLHVVWNEEDTGSTSIAYRRSSDNGATWRATALFGAAS